MWRVETEPALLLVAHRLHAGTYERVTAVDVEGPVPAPWGTVRIDLVGVGPP